jgi:cytochrome c oxidase assembly factor CtaG
VNSPHRAGAILPPLTVHSALSAWQVAPVVSAGLIVLAAGYLACAWRIRRAHPARPWPAARAATFFLGLVVIAVATQSSVGVYDDVLFSDHMVQHVLLIMVAPPLLVAGRPVTLVMHAMRNPVHRWVKRLVRSRLVAALTFPPAATLLYCMVVAGTHTPPVMDLVLASTAAHDGEHALYLVAGYLFFLPVIGSEPIRWRMSIAGRYLVMLPAMMVDSFTGIVFTFPSREVFAPYAHAGRAWGPSLVTDLHAGGYVMLAGSDLAMTAVAIVLLAVMAFAGRSGGRGGVLFGGDGGDLAGRVAAAGIRSPISRRGDGCEEEDQRLAAYNAYLAELSGGKPAGEAPAPEKRRLNPAS